MDIETVNINGIDFVRAEPREEPGQREPLIRRIELKVTETEYHQWTSFAKAIGISTSEMIRRGIADCTRRRS